LEEAVEVYDEALAHYAGDDFIDLVYYGKAEALAALGKWEETVETYGQAIYYSPDYPVEDLLFVGITRFKGESYAEAIAYFEAAAKSDPGDYNLYYNIGLAWLALERYDKAASYFDAASELAPDYAPAWERKAWTLGLMGRYEAALESADRALAIAADDPDAWNTKGKVLLFSGEAAAARECFDRALARYPSSPEALLAKGITYFAEAKYDKARPYFEELSGAGGSPGYVLYLYFIDRAEGRPGTDRLQPLFESPADTWPKDASLFLVGRISAEDLLAEAAGDEEMLCEAHFLIGYRNKLDGDAVGARRHFDEAVATGQNDLAEYNLARYELARLGALKAALVRVVPPGITGTAAADSLRSSAVIARIVNQRKGGIEYVYEKYLKTNPNLEGKIVVRFNIAASGDVTACSVVSSTLGNAAVEREVCDRIVTWRFPPIEEGYVTVVYPFVFYSAGAK